jgi:uncharacterized iron-regulated membrane protein
MFLTIALIGLIYLAVIFILVFLSMYLVHRWTANRIIKQAKQKTKAAEPVDGTDWFTYNSEAVKQRIEKYGNELRALTGEGRKKE